MSSYLEEHTGDRVLSGRGASENRISKALIQTIVNAVHDHERPLC